MEQLCHKYTAADEEREKYLPEHPPDEIVIISLPHHLNFFQQKASSSENMSGTKWQQHCEVVNKMQKYTQNPIKQCYMHACITKRKYI